MAKHLVVVESPAKAKTIKKYLGKDFEVLASFGHVRDLIPKEGAVDPNDQFKMKLQVIDRNAKHVDAIVKAARQADILYLATDPDREGEAISYDVYETLKSKRVLTKKPVHRVIFHEITQKAVQHAVDHPRDIDMDLVQAQRTRRALDYLVGFTLSPLLWRKIRRGLSAGRVQSPALSMIVEREIEIERFESKEYWTIQADGLFGQEPVNAKLITYQKEKVTQFTVTNEAQAKEYTTYLTNQGKEGLSVVNVDKKQRKRNPAPPFITSTLQQEAARKLGFTTKRTMRVAQQLYEGIDIGRNTVGLITYMRTDSVNLANDAITEIREAISKQYDQTYLPAKPRLYKTKSKNAQEAHEAIRPTSAMRTPQTVKDYLNDEQLKLYTLIYKRTIACQMIHATLNTVAIDLACGDDCTFRATGSSIAHPGFMAIYLEGQDDTKTSDKDEKLLPPMKEGDVVALQTIVPTQHFTEPPPRYSEASLVKSLEEHGIGRPSTYASIISTLQSREYVTLESKRFMPTDVGRIVSKFLTDYFTDYVEYGFTARMEDYLDEISRGEKEWLPLMDDFWGRFKQRVDEINDTVKRSDVTQEKIDENCPQCDKPLSIRLGKRGRFIGCTAYPDCDYTRNVGEDSQDKAPVEVIEGRQCPECEHDLHIKAGRYGKFIGCSNYPNCRFMEPLEKPKDTEVSCPKCKKGNILERKSRRGKIFYSCARYPDCDYALWNKPIIQACPKCEWPILTIKTTKRKGTEIVCPEKNCSYNEPYEDDSTE